MVHAEEYNISDQVIVGELEVFQECDLCPEMIVLPVESFTMGAPLAQSASIDIFRIRKEGEVRGLETEGPEHRVEIDIPIAIGRNEVTFAEWMACYNAGQCRHRPDPVILAAGTEHTVTANHPVVDVSLEDIMDFVAWINEISGSSAYRLPTEAEWEFAARSGTSSSFAQGDTLRRDQAQYLGADDPAELAVPVPVEELDAANIWGVRHMSGNVMERVLSCWSERHHEFSTSSAYLLHDIETVDCKRVSKGGSYNAGLGYARPAARSFSTQTLRSQYSGFRLVRELR